jgi:hypothetical protein
MSNHQITQAHDDALICCGVHQRLCALLAQLQVGLFGYTTQIASYHATSVQNLHRIGTLTKRNTIHALLHFNVVVVVKQADVAHFERGPISSLNDLMSLQSELVMMRSLT